MNPNVSALLAAFGVATMVFMQAIVKTLFEKLPGINLASNKTLHDNGLRFIQYVINLAFLVCVDRFGGSFGAALFTGWHWWDFMFAALGSAVTSQLAYYYGGQGGSETIETPSAATSAHIAAMAHTDAAGGAPYLAPTDIPTVPR